MPYNLDEWVENKPTRKCIFCNSPELIEIKSPDPKQRRFQCLKCKERCRELVSQEVKEKVYKL